MAKEMLLVDPALIDTMQMNNPPALNSHNITNRVIQEADASINNALFDKMLPPSEQLLYYNQALQKREQYVDQKRFLKRFQRAKMIRWKRKSLTVFHAPIAIKRIYL